MMLLIALNLLYISQLVYVSDRWVQTTRSMVENGRATRMRNAVNWKRPPAPRKRKKAGLWG